MSMTHRPALLAAAFAVLTVLSGCGADDAKDPSEAAPTTGTTDTTSGTPGTTTGTRGPGSYPHFAEEDYSYVLETICFCPLLGPTRITVEDGEVTSAVVMRGGRGFKAGSQAPDFRRMTINDVIDEANDRKHDDVDVVWPAGQDWPSRVTIDQIERAVDDEISYVIRNVRIG